MASPAVLQDLSNAADRGADAFKKETLSKLGDIKNLGMTKNYVLVALYIGGKYIPGTKLLATDTQIKEYVWQAQVGFVVNCGPTAFKEKDGTDEAGAPLVGDWCTFSPGDGKRLQYNGVDLRVLHEDNIYGTVPDPALVTWRS